MKLNPVIPALENVEPSSGEEKDPRMFKNISMEKVKPAREKGVLNSTGDPSENGASAEAGPVSPKERVQDLVKQEQDRLEKEKNKKEEIESQERKPTSSQSVESTSNNDEAAKVKSKIMKLKDYDVDKEPTQRPLIKTPDPETLNLKKVKAPSKYKKEKEKKETIKLKPPGSPSGPTSPVAPKKDGISPKTAPLRPPNSADKETLKPSQVTPP